jgi:hypothetical protein
MAALWAAGCGGEPPSNLSPTADQDPARLERAVAANDAFVRQAAEAEKKALRNNRAFSKSQTTKLNP